MRSVVRRGCATLALCMLLLAGAEAAVFTGIEYGRDGENALLLDVRTPAKPGPFPVWVEWVERNASSLIVPDREVHAADTVLIRAVMPRRTQARRAAAAQLLNWLPRSLSGYGGDPQRVILIVRGAGGQALLDLWQTSAIARPDAISPPRSVRALVLVKPPAALRGHAEWPDLPLLLIDEPARSDALWRTALRLRNRGIAAEPSIQAEAGSASPGLSVQIAAMLAASDVARVQRFDQLSFDVPIKLEGRLLDALRSDTGLTALLWDRLDRTVRLVAVDAEGRARESHRWTWRDDARLVQLGGTLLALGSDTRGRARAEFRAKEGEWRPMSVPTMTQAVRLAAIAQRDAYGLAVAWSVESRSTPAASWLHRVERLDSSPAIVDSRKVARTVAALAFAGPDVIVAPASANARDGDDVLLRWKSGSQIMDALAGVGATPWQAIWSLSPDSAAGATIALLGVRAGRVYRIDLSCRLQCVHEELDLAGLLDARRDAPAAQWLHHPETGEALLALLHGPEAKSAQADSSRTWLVRQRHGRYGIARLPETAAFPNAVPRAVLPWPTQGDPGRQALLAGSPSGTLLFPARMQRSNVMPGLWWDRMRSGHGFDLRRSGEGWQVTVYTFDRRGLPTWYRSEGEIHGGRWRADTDGLLAYRSPDGSGVAEIDRRVTQSMEIVFAPGEPGDCTVRGRPGATLLARASLSIGGELSGFCLEPLRLAAGGRPGIDVDGIWGARDEASPWQLALTSQGEDPHARISAMLTYFDRSGAPRWAYAANDWRGGSVELSLFAVRGGCAVCAPRPLTSRRIGVLTLQASGECGSARVNASLRVMDKAGATGMPPGAIELAPVALLGCY